LFFGHFPIFRIERGICLSTLTDSLFGRSGVAPSCQSIPLFAKDL